MRCLSRIHSILTTIIGAIPWIQAVFGQNVTVDDADSNMIYAGFWQAGNDCSACWAKPPDHSQIYQATWHDTTAHPTDEPRYFQYQFTGTDLYIYSIQVNYVPVADPTYGAVSKVDLTLTIDGQSQNYQHPIINDGTFQYQVPVFAVHNLANTAHNMRVTLNPYSMFLFDYLVYTAVPSGANPPSTTPASDNSIPTTSSSTTSPSGNSSSGTSSLNTSSTPASSSASASTASSLTASSSTISPFVTSVANSANTAEKSTSLSSGAIAGIGIGAAVVIGAITAFVGFCYGQRRRRRAAASGGTLMEAVTPLTLSENPPLSYPNRGSASPLSPQPYMKMDPHVRRTEPQVRQMEPQMRHTEPQEPQITPSSPFGEDSSSLPPYSEAGDV